MSDVVGTKRSGASDSQCLLPVSAESPTEQAPTDGRQTQTSPPDRPADRSVLRSPRWQHTPAQPAPGCSSTAGAPLWLANLKGSLLHGTLRITAVQR